MSRRFLFKGVEEEVVRGNLDCVMGLLEDLRRFVDKVQFSKKSVSVGNYALMMDSDNSSEPYLGPTVPFKVNGAASSAVVQSTSSTVDLDDNRTAAELMTFSITQDPSSGDWQTHAPNASMNINDVNSLQLKYEDSANATDWCGPIPNIETKKKSVSTDTVYDSNMSANADIRIGTPVRDPRTGVIIENISLHASPFDRSVTFMDDSLDVSGTIPSGGCISGVTQAPSSKPYAVWHSQSSSLSNSGRPISKNSRSNSFTNSPTKSVSVGLAGTLGSRRMKQYYSILRWLEQMNLVDLSSIALPRSPPHLLSPNSSMVSTGGDYSTVENANLLKIQLMLTGCRDGLLLCKLLSRVTNINISVPFPSPSNNAQRLSNLKIAISAMTSGQSNGSTNTKKVPLALLDAISLTEIAEGKVDTVLRLLLAIKKSYTLVC